VGVLIFGDLDNLKKINDTFGHDEGDYAIRTAAAYLKKALRDSDIVARIGGDEFAAFAVVTPEMAGIIKDIPPRIKSIAAEHNKQSEKPYNVCMSVGIYTFECGEDISIRDYMDKADSALYKDKKNKDLDIMKKPEN
ncbi:MAG: GGDEF domain-containing protein, partial [Oscillospiraceae bacterium]